MIKQMIMLVLSTLILSAIQIPVQQVKTQQQVEQKVTIFGANLFNGGFKNSTQHRYNPEYIINIGDVINLDIWGAYEKNLELTVDEQGNVFLPKIGAVKLLGVKNVNLTKKLQNTLIKKYKKNVHLYASLKSYQTIDVFVSGAINNPGLYSGLSSDSVLQFLDKAKGISDNGSYRDITILRENKIIATIDLYDYLLSGKLNIIQFKTGDVINVGYLKQYITVDGDVKKPLQIELKGAVKLKDIIDISKVSVDATDIIISRYKDSKLYKFVEKITPNFSDIKAKDNIKFVSNNYVNNINIVIDGEHNDNQHIVVKKGTTLKELISIIKLTNLSAKANISLYRQSIAKLQKELLSSSLKDLESSVLKTASTTTDEAIIRKQEASLVLDFIKRAKEIEPKGRVILNDNTDLSKITLEDGDKIYIPKHAHIITIAGDVAIPSAISYVDGMDVEKYIEQCGGLTSSADKQNILIIDQKGKVSRYNNSIFSEQNLKIKAGDSILVLTKPDTKNLQITKDITQILYQIAVSAGVLVRL